MSNNEEEDKTCCSFWISRQWYLTTPRNAGNSLSNQHSNRKAQSPFKLCSHKLEDSFTKINTPLAGRENITPFRMLFPFFFFFYKSKWIILMQKLHEYIHPGRVYFSFIYIYMYIYDSDWHRRQKKQAIFTLFLLVSNARQCFSDAIGTQYLGCTHSWCLRIHTGKCNCLWKACLRDTAHNDLVSLHSFWPL